VGLAAFLRATPQRAGQRIFVWPVICARSARTLVSQCVEGHFGRVGLTPVSEDKCNE